MRNRLRNGGAREARPPLPGCVEVSRTMENDQAKSNPPLTRDRLPTRVARDPRFERLTCTHSGTYADDCLVQRVTAHKSYVVATCDRELRRRIRKIPGVPLMYIVRRRYAIERLPDQGAPV